jgi:pimeloyl-ACP methyl ester carboxylesterase
MLHGLRSQKASPEMLEKIKIFNDKGFSVIAIDFRNHGLSGEGNFTFGTDEINDVYTTVNYFYENKGLKSFGIWGFSYGATTALFSGLEFYNQTSNVELLGIFAESPYLDLLEVFTDQVAYRTPLNKNLANLLKPGTIFLTNLVFDFNFNSIKKTFGNKNEISFPTVVVSCANDEIVPASQSRKIVEILGSNATYEEFNNCNSHGGTLNSDPERYHKILENLFK